MPGLQWDGATALLFQKNSYMKALNDISYHTLSRTRNRHLSIRTV